VLWLAALIGIPPFASWLQAGGGVLMLLLVGSVLLLVASSVLYGLSYALRHIRDWPHSASVSMTFLKRNAFEIARAALMLFAVALMFTAVRTYYGCHFEHECWTMSMMARADNSAVEIAGSGIAIWAFVAWLRRVRH